MMGRVWCLCALLIVAGLAPACGKVMLKPVGESAKILQQKSLSVTANIEGQFAATALTMVFANESDRRIEAEIMYEMPAGAVPTYFAYWYGEEKVVARIAEKERAKLIYAAITSRMHDPALVEMDNARTLHAKIFPVMPNSDLKVELHFTQPLPAAPRCAAAYLLPLLQAETTTLQHVDITVHVRGAGLTGVTNNFGLPVTQEGGDYQVHFTADNYRPTQDLSVCLRRKAGALTAVLMAAPAGGPDGFFALALTSASALRRPRVAIHGVATYDLYSDLPANMKAGTAYYIYGRYRGCGAATVTLRGQRAAGRVTAAAVQFGASRVADNMAAQLWAAKRMAALSMHGRNKQAVMALSSRFNIPSKYTAWIAIPAAELQRYKAEKDRADIQAMANELVRYISAGRGDSPAARRLRKAAAAKARALGERLGDYLREAYDARAGNMAEELANMVRTHREHTPRARRLRRILVQLARETDQNVDDLVGEQLWLTCRHLAQELVYEQHQAHPSQRRLARLRADLHHCTRYTNQNPEVYLQNAEGNWRWTEEEITYRSYTDAMLQENPDPKKTKALRETLTRLFIANEGKEYGGIRIERLTARLQAQQVQTHINRLVGAGQEVPAPLRSQVQAYNKRESELAARMGDPLINADAPADAQQVVAVLPSGEMIPLAYNMERRRWEAHFDIPAYAKDGEYEITILILLKDGTRRTQTMHYHVDLTPPAGAAVVQVVADPQPSVRLTVTADPDTARVLAVLPWGDRVALIATAPGRFFTVVPLPVEYRGRAWTANFLLTDRAHNRTTLTATAVEAAL